MEMSGSKGEIAEAAGEVLEQILGLMGVSASVVLADEFPMIGGEESSPSVALDIRGEDPGILIGRGGQTLAALQYIVRIIVAHKTQTRPPIIIDVEGYKRRRWEALQAFAWRMAEQVQTKGEPFALEPMSAFERRVIHIALADHPGVTTESTGMGEARKVVILPKEREA